jgi:hypothetical protein
MSDALRTEPDPAPEGAEPDRDAKIEQLLLVGLDHYFAAEYEQAINVWTRALFLDRSHARARAYIERARSALSERLRQSEELLHDGVAAFDRGESGEARRLLEAAMVQGAPRDQALSLLERLDRLEQGNAAQLTSAGGRTGTLPPLPGGGHRSRRHQTRLIAWAALVIVLVAAGAIFAVPNLDEWRAVFTPEAAEPPAQIPPSPERILPIPGRAETTLTRARTLADAGRLHDALKTLETIRVTDPLREEADRLRADIQRRLIALATPNP